MVAENILRAFGTFAFHFISRKVATLVERHGYRRTDRDELYQSFAKKLHERRARFDPRVGTWEAFVVVWENHFATLLEHDRAAIRSRRREARSLDEADRGSEGRTRSASLDEAQATRHRNTRIRSDRELFELRENVQTVVRGLSDLQQRICAALLHHGCVSKTARELGVTRNRLMTEIDFLREKFERAEMRAYL